MNDQYLWFNYPEYKLPKLSYEGDSKLETLSDFLQKHFDEQAKYDEQKFDGCWCGAKRPIMDYMKKYAYENKIDDYTSKEYREEQDKLIREHLVRCVRWAKVNASFKI